IRLEWALRDLTGECLDRESNKVQEPLLRRGQSRQFRNRSAAISRIVREFVENRQPTECADIAYFPASIKLLPRSPHSPGLQQALEHIRQFLSRPLVLT